MSSMCVVQRIGQSASLRSFGHGAAERCQLRSLLSKSQCPLFDDAAAATEPPAAAADYYLRSASVHQRCARRSVIVAHVRTFVRLLQPDSGRARVHAAAAGHFSSNPGAQSVWRVGSGRGGVRPSHFPRPGATGGSTQPMTAECRLVRRRRYSLVACGDCLASVERAVWQGRGKR